MNGDTMPVRGRSQNPLHTLAKRNVACPACGAAAGESCRKARGGIAWPPHTARLDAVARSFRKAEGR